MGSTADISSQIDAPEAGTVQAVTVEQGAAGKTVVGIVVAIGGIPLQNYLILSVAIHVAHRGIIGGIGEGTAVGSFAVSRFVHRNG